MIDGIGNKIYDVLIEELGCLEKYRGSFFYSIRFPKTDPVLHTRDLGSIAFVISERKVVYKGQNLIDETLKRIERANERIAAILKEFYSLSPVERLEWIKKND